MTLPPNRKCWNANREIHIGTCADSWEGDVFCVCNPADEPEYLDTVPLYVGATIDGVSSANIKAYFNDIIFDTYYAKSSSYIWMWADYVSNGSHGTIRFDLCSGSTVIASRSTKWIAPCPEYATKTYTCANGAVIVTHNCVGGEWVATGNVCPDCIPGDTETITCEDGSIVVTRQCKGDYTWIDYESDCEQCHSDPVAGVYPSRYMVCDDGSKAGFLCNDAGEWVPVERCPEDDPEPDTGEHDDDDTPDTGEPDDEIGDEIYDDESELETDLSSLFGDIKPIYIIAAIIALILLGGGHK